tara:strand:+ start:407 stop:1270 length:864 start_codon:yes stop_codon:yes gene_type:complete
MPLQEQEKMEDCVEELKNKHKEEMEAMKAQLEESRKQCIMVEAEFREVTRKQSLQESDIDTHHNTIYQLQKQLETYKTSLSETCAEKEHLLLDLYVAEATKIENNWARKEADRRAKRIRNLGNQLKKKETQLEKQASELQYYKDQHNQAEKWRGHVSKQNADLHWLNKAYKKPICMVGERIFMNLDNTTQPTGYSAGLHLHARPYYESDCLCVIPWGATVSGFMVRNQNSKDVWFYVSTNIEGFLPVVVDGMRVLKQIEPSNTANVHKLINKLVDIHKKQCSESTLQ